uniref:G_PROTEIN_RECEP_F1_2 domain-containing protein n=1 Tax=Panagrellus redivivus TaxID=6233 RepID=A0A7E4ZYG5_PANRE
MASRSNGTFNHLNICLSDKNSFRVHGSQLEKTFYIFFFPPLCIIGIIGNLLNLMVLLSSESRTRRTAATQRSSGLLVALAFCDIFFLLIMVPHSMANFDFIAFNYTFRYYYLSHKQNLLAIANWCSAATVWLVIAICAERLLGIRSLLRARGQWPFFSTTRCLLGCIIFGSFVITFYNHFTHDCILKELCNHTQIIGKCFDIREETWPGNHSNNASLNRRLYVRYSVLANVFLVIAAPIVTMIALNTALLYVVRKQSFVMYNRLNTDVSSMSGGQYGRRRTSGEKTSETVPAYAQNVFRRSIDQTLQSQAEHRVTVTVCFIVTCFTITQGPSAITQSINFFFGSQRESVLWYHANIVTGFLVIIGKTLNFILFCLSSSSFRRRLSTILQKKFLNLSRRSSFLTNSTVVASQNSIKKKGLPMTDARKTSVMP